MSRVVGDRHDNSFLFLRTVPNAAFPNAFTTDITVNPGYAVAGIGLDVRVDRALTVYIRGNNITDTEYDSALGYPGLPRTVMVGASSTSDVCDRRTRLSVGALRRGREGPLHSPSPCPMDTSTAGLFGIGRPVTSRAMTSPPGPHFVAAV